jgi:hypothetical protein
MYSNVTRNKVLLEQLAITHPTTSHNWHYPNQITYRVLPMIPKDKLGT